MNGFDWTMLLKQSFVGIGQGFIEFIPKLVIALVLFLVGWLVAVGLAKIVHQVLRAIQLDAALASAGLKGFLERGGFRLDSGRFFGELVKWFVIFVFLIPALQVLGLSAINTFIETVVLAYIPQVISAVIILVVAALASQFLQRLVVGSVKAMGMTHANFLGAVTKWVIWILGILAALVQLGIAPMLIQTAFTGVIIALAIAVGLAFGLGGQEAAREVLDKVRREVTHK